MNVHVEPGGGDPRGAVVGGRSGRRTRTWEDEWGQRVVRLGLNKVGQFLSVFLIIAAMSSWEKVVEEFIG
jgi:hypothetical protein